MSIYNLYTYIYIYIYDTLILNYYLLGRYIIVWLSVQKKVWRRWRHLNLAGRRAAPYARDLRVQNTKLVVTKLISFFKIVSKTLRYNTRARESSVCFNLFRNTAFYVEITLYLYNLYYNIIQRCSSKYDIYRQVRGIRTHIV